MNPESSSASDTENQPKVWVTGAGGLIGNYLCQRESLPPHGWQMMGLTRSDLDLADLSAVRRAFQKQQPDLIIHCAALSKSPDCQANPPLARMLNVEVTAALTELAADIPFIFFSTDLVFDGQRGNYNESSAVNPLSVYAETKVAAEKVVLANPRHTVVRTSLNGGTSPTGNRAFNEELRLAWQQKRALKLFTDEFRCPNAAVVTARAIWELAASGQTGLYHLAGSERLSRWEIGKLIAARWPQLEPQLQPASLREYVGATRPPDCSLDCTKIQKLLSFPLPSFSAWLAENSNELF